MVFKMGTMLFLLLSLTGTSMSATCPPEEDLDYCICRPRPNDRYLSLEHLELECYGREVGLDSVNRSLQAFGENDIISLDISYKEWGSLPSDIFKGFNIRKLDLSHTEMTSLAEEGARPFTGLEDTLEVLVMVSSGNVSRQLDLSHLRRLTYLDLTVNAITEVNNKWTDNIPTNLTYLDLSKNAISSLGNRAFRNLEGIQRIYLEENQISYLSRSMFPYPAKNLKTLMFSFNSIRNIPEDLFTEMPKLEFLSIKYNHLTTLDEEIFSPIWKKLYMLNVEGLDLDCDDAVIGWMFHNKPHPRLYHGKCYTPEKRHDMDLDTLVRLKNE